MVGKEASGLLPRRSSSRSSTTSGGGAYVPYGGALAAYRTYRSKAPREAVSSKKKLPSAASTPSSLWGRFAKAVGLSGSNASGDDEAILTSSTNDRFTAPDGVTKLPLRDFLYPTLGCPEGEYFCSDTASTYGVMMGDLLQPAKSIGSGSPVVVVIGSRSGCLWVASRGDHPLNSNTPELLSPAYPLTVPVMASSTSALRSVKSAADIQKFFTRVASEGSVVVEPLEPAGWWGEAVTSFLMFAPDLASVAPTSSGGEGEEELVVLSPTVTLVGNTTVLGWAGERSIVDGESGQEVSWSAAITIPPQ